MRQALCLGLQVSVPTAVVAVDAPLVHFERPGHDSIEHVAIVGDQDERAAILLAKIGFEPFDRVGVEMVGLGIVVSLGKGLFVGTGPIQLLSSARRITKNRRDRVCFSSAKKFFIEDFSWK